MNQIILFRVYKDFKIYFYSTIMIYGLLFGLWVKSNENLVLDIKKKVEKKPEL